MRTRNVTRACRAPLLALALAPALCVQAAGPSPGTRYLHADHLGSTVAWSDSAGDAVQYTTYWPYGTPHSVTRRANGAVAGQFTGKARDAGTGLYYFGARYQDPALGRFLGPDAARQTRSPYDYVKAAPLRNVDPDGNITKEYAREALRTVARVRSTSHLFASPKQRRALANAARYHARISVELLQEEIRIRSEELRELKRKHGMSNFGGYRYNLVREKYARWKMYRDTYSWARRKLERIKTTQEYDGELPFEARQLRSPFEGRIDVDIEPLAEVPVYQEMVRGLFYASTYGQQKLALEKAAREFASVGERQFFAMPDRRPGGNFELSHRVPYKTMCAWFDGLCAVHRKELEILQLEEEAWKWEVVPGEDDYLTRYEERGWH